jgi:hypothetical protein
MAEPENTEFRVTVETGRPAKWGRKYRHQVAVRSIDPPTLRGDRFAARAVGLARIVAGVVPVAVLYDFREWTATTREEAIRKARTEVESALRSGLVR